jgi:hypothetical protein
MLEIKANLVIGNQNGGRTNLANHPGFPRTVPVLVLKIPGPKNFFSSRQTANSQSPKFHQPPEGRRLNNTAADIHLGYVFTEAVDAEGQKDKRKKIATGSGTRLTNSQHR